MNRPTILGAIAGDTIGSIYEFAPIKTTKFELLNPRMEYTDDSIMTIAVAEWIMTDKSLSAPRLVERMKYWGNKYRHPMGAYGGMFSGWLRPDVESKPYGSYGNGSAMRVSAVGFAFDTLDETLRVAQTSAAVTHDHPEGIKGAQATAAAIFLARTGHTKDEIRQYVEDAFGYDLHRTCDQIRPTYSFDGTCQRTVPESIIAFLDSTDFESAVRLTVSLGGDADTMGAITGAIAAAFYGSISPEIVDFTLSKLPDDLRAVVEAFEHQYCK